MGQLIVSVKKLTDVELMREACETTFDGVSHASLTSIYKSEHSPARTQLFWVKLKGVKLFVATHLIRHHVGSQPFQLTCRDDRQGGSPGQVKKCHEIVDKLEDAEFAISCGELALAKSRVYSAMDEVNWLADHADRNTPVNLSLLINAQSLIDMAKLRLCTMASAETRQAFEQIMLEISKVDDDLAKLLVRKCVYRGGLCGEPRCCGYNSTELFKGELKRYASLFTEKQRGLIDVDALCTKSPTV